MMINMGDYSPIMTDPALNIKIRVMALSGFLIVLGTTFVIYAVTNKEILLLLMVFMGLLTYIIYLMFYYLIQFLLFPYG